MKNTLKGINNNDWGRRTYSGWEDRIVEITTIEQNRETRKIKEMKMVSEITRTILSHSHYKGPIGEEKESEFR